MKRKRIKLNRKQIQPIKKQKPMPSEPEEVKAFREVVNSAIEMCRKHPNEIVRRAWQNPFAVSLAKSIVRESIIYQKFVRSKRFNFI